MTRDLNDSLDALFAGDTGPVRTDPVRPNAVEFKRAETRFTETCPKCNGGGKFITYSGRVLGDCFACKGAGRKTFKNSSADRAKAREQAAGRKAASKAEDIAAFKAREPAVHAWLVEECSKAKPFEFAIKMVEALNQWGDLTEGQLAACQRLVARNEIRNVERAKAHSNAVELDVSAIEDAFASARAKAQRKGQMGVMVKPIKLAAGPAKTDVVVRVQPGSLGSQWEGQIFFKNGEGDRKLGYVKGGKFIRQFACTDVEAEAIVKVAATPKEALVAYAKAWSKCGVCGRGLLNDESIERGIGPICFEKLGF